MTMCAESWKKHNDVENTIHCVLTKIVKKHDLHLNKMIRL